MVSQTETQLAMPTAEQPVTDSDGKPTLIWWRFWQGLFTRNAVSTPHLVGTAITAAGTTQATATELTAEWNEVTTTPANSGVLLDDFGEGNASIVWNMGANALKVYPPLGAKIDAGATNAAYSLAIGKCQVFNQLSATQFRSLQLG